MRTMVVIVRGIAIQDDTQMPWPGDQHPVGDLGPGLFAPSAPHMRSPSGCALTTSIPASASTASNAAQSAQSSRMTSG
jgi:hypothetical protein